MRLGYTGTGDLTCVDPNCEYQPVPHGMSHEPTAITLIFDGPGFKGQFRIGTSYIDHEAIDTVMAHLTTTLKAEWDRLRTQ